MLLQTFVGLYATIAISPVFQLEKRYNFIGLLKIITWKQLNTLLHLLYIYADYLRF